MSRTTITLLAILIGPTAVAAQQQPAAPASPEKLKELPPGRHALMERLTQHLNLTMDQELEIEPILHAEESVTKPLLKYSALTPDEQQGIMTTIKLAARRQIRPLLTPEQQKGMDQESENVRQASKKGGGKKGGAAKAPDTKPDVFADEEALSSAIVAYAALNADEKHAMLVEVKQAARRSADAFTAEQRMKIDADLEQLAKGGK